MKSIQGLGEIAGDYDLFLIDQWGVIHDGETPYDGAVDALAELKALGRSYRDPVQLGAAHPCRHRENG